MRTASLFAFALGLVALAGTAAADEKGDKKALEELQGEYEIIELQQGKMKLTQEDLKKIPDPKLLLVVIKGDQIVSNFTRKGAAATIKLDSSKKPAHLDISTPGKDGKSLVDYGIYKFEDGVLTICTAPNSQPKDRPTEFKAGDNAAIIKMKKKPAK